MAQIIYQIHSGIPSFTAQLFPLGIKEDQHHTEKGEYSFDDVPNGYYVLTVTDSVGCKSVIEISTGVVETYSVQFNNYACTLKEVTTTITTLAPTTLAPTTVIPTTIVPTTTFPSTTICARPGGLSNFTFYRYITKNGVTFNFTSTLELATQACYDRSNVAGTNVAGNSNQTSSLEVGSLVYSGITSSCNLVQDGYYMVEETHKIVHIVNGYITEILIGCGYPTTTVFVPSGVLGSITLNLVDSITTGSARGKSTLIFNGTPPIYQRGLVWEKWRGTPHLNPVPTIENSFVSLDGIDQGIKYKTMSDLESGAYYGVRAYVTNSAGTAYSNQIQFQTTPPAIFVPDAFSPNGDGVHDTFDIFNLHYYPNNEMWIFFYEGGQTIYHTKYYHTAPWNGGENNVLANKVNKGTYYYILKVNGKTFKKAYVYVSY